MLAVIVYGKSVKYDFVHFDDDVLILNNYEYISDYKNIPKFFLNSVFCSNADDDNFYRPVLTLSFLINAMISGKEPYIYHATNVFLHIVSIVLIYIFFRKLSFDGICLFLFMSLFAVHPAFTHAVAWIPGRNDVLLAIFIISSLIILFDYFKNTQKQNLRLAVFYIMFAAALFTKENAAVMIIAVPVFMFLFCANVSKKDYITVICVMFFLSAAYAVLRKAALGNPPVKELDFIYVLQSILVYFECLVIPYRIYLFPDKADVNIITAISFIIILIPFAASFFFGIGRKKVLLFGAFWFLAFLLPVFMGASYILTHRIYFVSLGGGFIFLEFFTSLAVKMRFLKKYIVFLNLALVVIFAFSAYIHVNSFKNQEVFLMNADIEHPGSEALILMHARYYAEQGRLDKAKKELSKIISKDGSYSETYLEILGYVYALEGEYDKAAAVFEHLHKQVPLNAAAVLHLSEIYFLKEEYQKALYYAGMLVSMSKGNKTYIKQYDKIKSSAEKYENTDLK